jgi:hypothetical protein
MTVARALQTATLLLDGRVLIAGGALGNVGYASIPTNSAELYDPSTGIFTPTGSMTVGRALHTATLLPDGRVLIAGGNFGGSVVSAEIYDPSTGSFDATGSMAATHTLATLLDNGKVLMTGSPAPNAEIYDPATGMFTPAGAYAASALGLLTANLLADGNVLITGCKSDCGYDADLTQLYEPATGTFSLTGGQFDSIAPTGRTSTLLINGTVLFTGGASEDSWYPYADLYDPSTGTFTRTGDMNKARDNHTATLLPDGTVLIAGGRLDYGPPCCITHQTAELYNPPAGIFRSIGNMTARRGYHTATLLRDGSVLLAGGLYINTLALGPPNILASAEIYTPFNLVPAAALLSLSGGGHGQGTILHADTHQVASPDNPAVAGEALEIYCTGLAGGGAIPPQVSIGARMAEILFFGKAPGFADLNQVNVRLPDGVDKGDAVPVRLSYLGRPSNEVTIGVR